MASNFSASPTRSSSFFASSVAEAPSFFFTSVGASMMFLPTVRCGNRLKLWKIMPTCCRNSRKAGALSWSRGLPSTVSAPCWNTSRPLMQRSKVLLPDPLLPMMAITSPFFTVRSMPLSTSFAPNDLRKPVISTTVFIHAPLELSRIQADREAQREIQQGDAAVHDEGLERGVADHGAGLRQFDESDHRSQCGALDHLDQETDRGRDRDAGGLRQHHMAQLLAEVHGQALCCLPLALGNGGHAAAPDFREEGAGVQRQRQSRGHPGRGVDAEQGNAEVSQEQLHQQRRALEQLDVAGHHLLCPSRGR